MNGLAPPTGGESQADLRGALRFRKDSAVTPDVWKDERERAMRETSFEADLREDPRDPKAQESKRPRPDVKSWGA